MTISTKTFQNLQPGVSAADDLRVRTPINQALQWLGEGLANELNAEFASISASLSNINSALAQISQSVSVQIAAYAAGRPAFHAHKNGTDQVSITSGAFVKVTFGTEDWDIGSFYDTATSVWTPPAGTHRVSAAVTFTATNGVDNESLHCAIYKNGTIYRQNRTTRGGAGGVVTASVAALVGADGDDTFEVYARKSGAGDGEIEGAVTDSWFSAEAIA
jgi:hypothetical protein